MWELRRKCSFTFLAMMGFSKIDPKFFSSSSGSTMSTCVPRTQLDIDKKRMRRGEERRGEERRGEERREEKRREEGCKDVPGRR